MLTKKQKSVQKKHKKRKVTIIIIHHVNYISKKYSGKLYEIIRRNTDNIILQSISDKTFRQKRDPATF